MTVPLSAKKRMGIAYVQPKTGLPGSSELVALGIQSVFPINC